MVSKPIFLFLRIAYWMYKGYLPNPLATFVFQPSLVSLMKEIQFFYDFCRSFGYLIARLNSARRHIRIEWGKCDTVFLMQDVKTEC